VLMEKPKCAMDNGRRKIVVGLPGYSHFAAAGVLEVLQLATLLSGDGDDQPEWMTVSELLSSECCNTGATNNSREILVIIGGPSSNAWNDTAFDAWLRRRAASGSTIGAIGSAVQTVARAGLLGRHRSALHPEILAGFKECHPDLSANSNLYSIDEKRFTCAGGSAVLDMMITLSARWYDKEVASQIANTMLHSDIRPPDTALCNLSTTTGQMPRRLKALLQLMENNIEFPLSISELADQSGVSPRQIQRLFHDYLGVVPITHYRGIRLDHARRLLRQTDMSITEIAFASGFANSSHFTRCFKEYFGVTPFAERISPLVSIEKLIPNSTHNLL
jgi:transcriptional regulator GlxA family with amidase domain